MKVVVNSTVIIGLAKINRLDILKSLFEEVYISQSVYEEIISGGKGKYGVIEIKQSDWIETKKVKNILAVRNLELDLDRGESETIVLAEELCVDYVILDDERARDAARCLNLEVIGTIGLLVRAKKKGLVKKVKPLLDELRNKKFWFSEDLYIEILKVAEE